MRPSKGALSRWLSAKLVEEGMQLHGHAIPRGYAKVSIYNILKKKYNNILLDHSPEKDKPTLGDNRTGFVPSRK
jgi:hypothetical protein